MSDKPKPKTFLSGECLFGLGMIVATPGAVEATSNQQHMVMLLRQATGAWSAKKITRWIITEGDRSTTTFLLPSEY